MWRFLWEYNTTVLRSARWARAEVEAWPEDLSELDVTAGFSRGVWRERLVTLPCQQTPATTPRQKPRRCDSVVVLTTAM
jgi:hypothetical protein